MIALNTAVMCVTHVDKFRNAYKHLFGATEGKRPFCKSKAKERLVLRWILKKCNVAVCIVCIRIRIAVSCGSLWTRL